MRLLRGRSTPAIRAIVLALPLLVARILLADDADHARTLDHPAMLTDRLYAAAYLHSDRPIRFLDSMEIYRFIKYPSTPDLPSGTLSAGPGRDPEAGGGLGQDPGPIIGHGDGMLEMGAAPAVSRDHGPPVGQRFHRCHALVHHGLSGQHERGLKLQALAGAALVGALRLFVRMPADAMAGEVSNDVEAGFFRIFLDDAADVAEPVTG